MASPWGTGRRFLWNACVCRTTEEKLGGGGERHGQRGGGWAALGALSPPLPQHRPLALDGAELVTLGEAEWVELRLEVDGLG